MLPHVSILGVAPDVGLVIAVLIGLMEGELEGLLVGLAIGWVLSMYSAGDLWLSLVTKGGAGVLAGILGRQVAQVTPTVLSIGLGIVSLFGGMVTALTMKAGGLEDVWWNMRTIVLPQACLDAALGAALFWLANRRTVMDRFRVAERF